MTAKFSATSYEFTEYRDARNYIGGAFVDDPGAELIDVINPRHGKAMARVPMSGEPAVAAAVEAAREAQPAWAEQPIRDRAQIFYRLRELLVRDQEELTWLVSHENGKVYEEAKASVLKAIECVEFGCSLPNLATGQQLDVSRGVNCMVVHEPLGVVAGICPFNFPLMVPTWMLPQAIVGGNAFVLKPSEQVPLSVQRLAELFEEAGLPSGIFNVINGGRAAVEALADHPGIAALAFVGSTAVGRQVYARAAATSKRVLCLGGAKNHLIVVPDADVELTTQNVVDSFTGCAGQRCMAASVMVGVGAVDALVDGIASRAATIRLGEQMGPITSAAAVQRITKYIDEAERAGVKVLVDGRKPRPAEHGNGYWLGPTVLDGVRPDMPAGCEEIFGPVLSIVRVDTVDQAIAVENRSEYGNAAAVYTTSGDVARKVMEGVSAGMCGVNIGVPVPREPFGFGGWNHSLFGHGNITGWDGFRFWTRPRKITSKWALQQDQTWMS
ncbi:MAG: CoA-acylating methylmalonate-semialdehyde dehydrogenase [Planctomycetota bacterium]